MEFILAAIAALVIILGFRELVRVIMLSVYETKPIPPEELLVYISNAETCEYQIRRVAEKLRWEHSDSFCKIICINLAENPEVDKICEILSKRYPNLVVSNYWDLEYNINRIKIRER